MNFLVREVLAVDTGKITRLSNQLGYSISETATLQNIETINKKKNEIIFVALAYTEVVGWIHVFQTTRVESGTFGEIGGLVVDNKYQGKGIGKMLVAQAKKWCISHEIPSLRVRCNANRTEAHQFYQALEFRENKQQKVFEINVQPT